MWATNKPHELAKQYLRITGKGWKQNFWGVYGFFKKQGAETWDLLHEYMLTLEGHHELPINELYNKARLWNASTKETKVKQSRQANYLELLKERKL